MVFPQVRWFLVVLLLASPALAQSWSLTTADFQSANVELKAISDSSLSVCDKPESGPGNVPLDDYLRTQRARVPRVGRAKFVPYPPSGGRLSGEPARLESETLHWNSPTLGELAVPMRDITTIARPAKSAPAA